MNFQILIVEDDPSILQLLQMVVRVSGYTYEIAKTGLDALKKLKTNDFLLVITDENLPGIKGHEIAEWMRGIDRYKDTPVILISAEQDFRLFSDLLAAGIITLFVPKPSSMNQLKATINLAMNMKMAVKSPPLELRDELSPTNS